MIAVRQQDGQQLMSETGETTRYVQRCLLSDFVICVLGVECDSSHLMGMFYRTLRIIDNGIKPCYVFDGAPPKLKNGEVLPAPPTVSHLSLSQSFTFIHFTPFALSVPRATPRFWTPTYKSS